MLFEADFVSKLSFIEAEVVREDDELSETRPHVVVSPECEEKQCSRLWDSDDGDEDDGDKDEDEVARLIPFIVHHNVVFIRKKKNEFNSPKF